MDTIIKALRNTIFTYYSKVARVSMLELKGFNLGTQSQPRLDGDSNCTACGM
jgi:hypothetical protein